MKEYEVEVLVTIYMTVEDEDDERMQMAHLDSILSETPFEYSKKEA